MKNVDQGAWIWPRRRIAGSSNVHHNPRARPYRANVRAVRKSPTTTDRPTRSPVSPRFGLASVKREPFCPVVVLEQRRLVVAQENVVLEDERVHRRSHETSVGILRRANDRLSPHVERRVHDDGTARALLERGKDRVID